VGAAGRRTEDLYQEDRLYQLGRLWHSCRYRLRDITTLRGQRRTFVSAS
jgi:hypothetical protein